MPIYQNITELIGKTPIVKLNHLVPEGAADVYVKLEAFNPGSSVKDRIALSMMKKQNEMGFFNLVLLSLKQPAEIQESVCHGSELPKGIKWSSSCLKL